MKQIIKISEDYFDYMARHFPVMCLSDEFYFFPRAKNAADFLDSLDSLDQDKIDQHIARVKRMRDSLEKTVSDTHRLEDRIDYVLLKQSMSTFLREFEEVKIWQIDPTLYLKIILLGIYKGASGRIKKIPRLLKEARNNLREVQVGCLEAACEMVNASMAHFKTISKESVEALEDYRKFLKKIPTTEHFIKGRGILEEILKNSFSYKRPLEEIFEIACEEYRNTLKKLDQLAKKINAKKNWQEILSKYKINLKSKENLLDLYSGQIEKLKKFLKEKNVISIPTTQNILVEPTPAFMKPVRASASYSAPKTDNIRESAHFYITIDFGRMELHNEYTFVTAHETYPGHHLLDSIRRVLKNPIRQQIESPLFYEGWASYAERLIDELGYIKNPRDKLVGLRRQAWRAARAMLDVGLRIGRLKLEKAKKMLEYLGYAPLTVELMSRHYLLTPGYQLCYTIGKFEFDNLRKRFSSKIGMKKFHDFVLEGGQIPFDLLEKRIENKLCRKNF